MKKNIYTLLSFFIALICGVSSCNKEIDIIGTSDHLFKGVIMSEFPSETKVTLSDVVSGGRYPASWKQGDQVFFYSKQLTANNEMTFTALSDGNSTDFACPEIKWGTNPHTFYAYYPRQAVKSYDVDYKTGRYNGKISLTLPSVQHGVVEKNGNNHVVYDPNSLFIRSYNASVNSSGATLNFFPCVNAFIFEIQSPESVPAVIDRITLDFNENVAGDCDSDIQTGEVIDNTGSNTIVVEFEPTTIKTTEMLKVFAFAFKHSYMNVKVKASVHCRISDTEMTLYKDNISLSNVSTGNAVTITLGRLEVPAGATGHFNNISLPSRTTKDVATQVSFDLGGVQDAIDNLSTIKVGLIGFEPTGANVSRYSNRKDNVDYGDGNLYTEWEYEVDAAEKTNGFVLDIMPTTAGDGYVHLSATDFSDETSSKSRIYATPYSISVGTVPSGTGTAKVSDLARDYTGGNKWLVHGQEGKIEFWLDKTGDELDEFAAVTLNGWACERVSGDDVTGYSAYRTTTAHSLTNSDKTMGETHHLTVNVQFTDGSDLDADNTVDVKVYGISLDSDTNNTGYDTSKIYVIASSDKYINHERTASAEYGINCLWEFSANSSSTAIKKADEAKYLRNDLSLGNSQNWTLANGLKFSYRSGLTTRYLKWNSNNLSTATGDNNNTWTIYPVSFNPPTP